MSVLAPNTIVHPFSHIEDAVIGADCSIGPYARIRPGSRLGPSVRIGNFVETKKATLGAGSKGESFWPILATRLLVRAVILVQGVLRVTTTELTNTTHPARRWGVYWL